MAYCSKCGGEHVPKSHKKKATSALTPADRKHLNAWLIRSVDEEEQADTLGAILRAIHDEPDLIERGYSWRQIADRGM